MSNTLSHESWDDLNVPRPVLKSMEAGLSAHWKSFLKAAIARDGGSDEAEN
jgi:hypothetical protein